MVGCSVWPALGLPVCESLLFCPDSPTEGVLVSSWIHNISTHTHTQHLLFWACLPVTVCLRCHCLAPGGFIKAQCPEVKSHSSPLLWSGSSSTSPPTTLPVFSPPICVCSPPFIFLLSVLTLPPFLSFKGPPSLKKKRRKKIKNKGGMKTGCRKESVSCLSEEPACLMTPSPVGYESSSSSPNFLFCLHIN